MAIKIAKYNDGSTRHLITSPGTRPHLLYVDGPAIEYSAQLAYRNEWFLHGKWYRFDSWLEENNYISDEEKNHVGIKICLTSPIGFAILICKQKKICYEKWII